MSYNDGSDEKKPSVIAEVVSLQKSIADSDLDNWGETDELGRIAGMGVTPPPGADRNG